MISDQYKCIYVHIPKTAGTSIEKALGHFDELKRGVQDHRSIREIEPLSTSELIKSLRTRDPFHCYRLIKKLINDEKNNFRRKYAEYFKFTFVRNPWARVFSWYKNVMRDDVHLKRFGVSSDCTFDDFVDCHLNQYEIQPQMFWIIDKNKKIPMNFIGKFENLENDFNLVAKVIGLELKTLPRLVVGENKNYVEYYNDRLIDIVYKKYKTEIECFEFEFGE